MESLHGSREQQECELIEFYHESRDVLEHGLLELYHDGRGQKEDSLTELYHYGAKGQKWGLRRFQNDDGSLTPAGRERYGRKSSKKQGPSLMKKASGSIKKAAANHKQKKQLEKARQAKELKKSWTKDRKSIEKNFDKMTPAQKEKALKVLEQYSRYDQYMSTKLNAKNKKVKMYSDLGKTIVTTTVKAYVDLSSNESSRKLNAQVLNNLATDEGIAKSVEAAKQVVNESINKKASGKQNDGGGKKKKKKE